MKISEVATKLGLKVFCGDGTVERELSGCYIGDLLSLAMSTVQKDNVWITIQTNVNIVAVSSLTEAGCVIIADGFEPDENTVEKAKAQDVTVLGSSLSAYELAKGLAEMGI